jgi:hypothetical protein
MNDLQFFLKAIWFLVLCAFVWFVTIVITGQLWVFPLLFVGLCVYAYYDVRKKRQHIAYLAAEAERTRKIAEEKQAIADRYEAEARAINERAERARARLDLEAEAEAAEADRELAEARKRVAEDLRNAYPAPEITRQKADALAAAREGHRTTEIARLDDGQPRFAGVAYTPDALQALLEEKPNSWRWAALVSILVQRRATLQPQLRDFRLGYAAPTGERARNGMEVAQFVIDAMSDILQTAQQINDFILSPAFSAVFGDPDDGNTADADGILHTATRLMDYYERFLVLAQRARGLAAPSEYTALLNNCARLSEKPIEGFDKFIDEFVDLIGELPDIVSPMSSETVLMPPIYLSIESDEGLLQTIAQQLTGIADDYAADGG